MDLWTHNESKPSLTAPVHSKPGRLHGNNYCPPDFHKGLSCRSASLTARSLQLCFSHRPTLGAPKSTLRSWSLVSAGASSSVVSRRGRWGISKPSNQISETACSESTTSVRLRMGSWIGSDLQIVSRMDLSRGHPMAHQSWPNTVRCLGRRRRLHEGASEKAPWSRGPQTTLWLLPC